eukprot:6214791-Pleurochrysis_carterae.AAC.3
MNWFCDETLLRVRPRRFLLLSLGARQIVCAHRTNCGKGVHHSAVLRCPNLIGTPFCESGNVMQSVSNH